MAMADMSDKALEIMGERGWKQCGLLLSLSPSLYLFLSVSLPLSLSLLSCVPCDCRPIRARGLITKRAMTPIRSLLFSSYLSQCLELSTELISFIRTEGVVIKTVHLWYYYVICSIQCQYNIVFGIFRQQTMTGQHNTSMHINNKPFKKKKPKEVQDNMVII